MHITPRRGRTATVIAAGVAAVVALSGCTASGGGGGASEGALLTVPREDTASFTPNFNPFTPDASPFTEQAIFEGMFIYNPADGQTTPWLAESWEATADGTGVTFHLRDDVQWSDGEPFTAEDVVYTFELQQEVLGGYAYVTEVSAPDDTTVEFTFDAPNSPAVFDVGQESIVPKHEWETFDDPATETNPEPVGTGPYTELANFGAQSFDLLPNPNYWQPDKQKIPGIRVLAFAGNDGANLAAANGEVDWAPQFIPNIQKAFVDKDPEHRHYWFPGTGSMIQWTLNTTKAPFDDVAVRKALSMAVDREQVTEIGMMGYAHPADCTGLSDNLDGWKDEAVLEACDWTTLDVDAANALLDEAGYARGSDGIRTKKDGSPFAFKISVGASSSDWLSVAQIIAENMKAIGVAATVDSPDWGQVVEGYEQGTFDTGIAWSGNGPTPWSYYRTAMSSTTLKPVGEQAFDNYHRFADPRADELLAQLAAAGDEAAQQAAANELQTLYSELAPVVPLFPGPEWGAFTDTRFTGWPTEDDPYATLSVRSPTTVLVLTTLEPVAK
ncbi:ABC transporter substrate-binding protein [Agromyces albus]|uniref:ABC transporter substrate-binding protein n=1 Tax=Agromyces albus TaxID=205332 RepID=UPI0027818EA4|nr:ABC transporter substrate-binding protein [Agromyces albus]MDQ0576645.1 peptide/nickel transport system substrate-binding protein [Agromyces albus]